MSGVPPSSFETSSELSKSLSGSLCTEERDVEAGRDVRAGDLSQEVSGAVSLLESLITLRRAVLGDSFFSTEEEEEEWEGDSGRLSRSI